MSWLCRCFEEGINIIRFVHYERHEVEHVQKNASMSNSGIFTSCFAVFIKIPIPAFRAYRSPSSLIVSGTFIRGLLCPGSGEALLVGGSVRTLTSMRIDDRRRAAGSMTNNGRRGFRSGKEWPVSVSSILFRVLVEKRSNDHDRTRSRAKA
jgi:hypothetical protein